MQRRAEGHAPSRMRAALDKAIADPTARRDLRIQTECHRDGRSETVRVYGTGVGIWGERTQFSVDNSQLTALLRAFARHNFLSLAESYGGRQRSPQHEFTQLLRVTCTVTLALPAGEWSVAQFEGGQQSAALKTLVSEIIERSEEPSRRGVTVSTVAEGLASVADGGLAPEALSVVAHFKPRKGTGWLLEIRDGQVTAQQFEERTGYQPRKRLGPARDLVRALAGAFEKANITGLPSRLAQEDYLELRLQVLDKHVELLARPLAGQQPPTASQQTILLQLRQELDGVHRLVVRQGRADP